MDEGERKYTLIVHWDSWMTCTHGSRLRVIGNLTPDELTEQLTDFLLREWDAQWCDCTPWDLYVVNGGDAEEVWDFRSQREGWELSEAERAIMRAYTAFDERKKRAEEKKKNREERRAQREDERTKKQERRQKRNTRQKVDALTERRREKIMLAELTMKTEGEKDYFFATKLQKYVKTKGVSGLDLSFTRKAMYWSGVPSSNLAHGEGLVTAVGRLAAIEGRPWDWDEVFEDICGIKEGEEDGK